VARILIVDDDPIDRMIMESLLGAEGHDLVFAEEGGAALELYRKRAFDLVLTDLVMPKFNGLRLIKELIASDPGALIIAVSGNSPDQLPRAEDYGAIDVLTKPIERDPLLRSVSAALARKP
jgi:CheY-like chemotaxis protein